MADIKIWTGATSGVFNVAGNWSPSGVPVSTDSIIYPKGATVAATGYNASAILLAAWTKEAGCAIAIGSQAVPMHIDADAVYYYGTGATYLQVDNCAAISADQGDDLYLSGASVTLLTANIARGATLEIANLTSQTFACTTISLSGAGEAILGAGVTMTTLNSSLATCANSSAATTINHSGGVFTHKAGAVTTVNSSYGTFKLDGTGTVTTLNKYTESLLDCSNGMQIRTITTINAYSPRIKDPYKVITWTTLNLIRCGVGATGGEFDLGQHLTITRGVPA